MGRKIVWIRNPKPIPKVIESVDNGSIPKVKTAENGIKRIDFRLSSPISKRMDFKIRQSKNLISDWMEY